MDDHGSEEVYEEPLPIGIYPCIYEGCENEEVPEGFNAVTIYLDGSVQSELDWTGAKEQALYAIKSGYRIMWDINLGLFTEFFHPLSHQGQFLSLSLSLEHFRDTLWREFKHQTIGLTIFRGAADFSQNFPWNDEQENNLKEWLFENCGFVKENFDLSRFKQEQEGQQLIRLFCRDVVVEYIALLAARLPDSLPCYLFLDASMLSSSSIHAIQLLNPERFDRLHTAHKGHQLPLQALGWEQPNAVGYSGKQYLANYSLPPAFIGICIPPLNFYHCRHYEGLEEGLLALQVRSLSFKLIAEAQLTSEWEGLDYILYCPEGLSLQGKRKLQGFCAAGGTVVSTGSLQGFPYEISLKEWLANL